MKAYATLFLTAWALFLVLTAPAWQGAQVAAGALVALSAAAMTRKLLPASFFRIFLKAVFYFLLYTPFFLWEMIKANLQIAIYCFLNPRLPIAPRIFRVKTRLASDGAKMKLANSITLTPGTLTVDAQEDELWIHCVRPISEQRPTRKNCSFPSRITLGGLHHEYLVDLAGNRRGRAVAAAFAMLLGPKAAVTAPWRWMYSPVALDVDHRAVRRFHGQFDGARHCARIFCD